MTNASFTATLKYALTSHKKMLLLAKLVQGKQVDEAIRILEFTPKKAAKVLAKVIKSARANATTNAKQDPESLYVQTIQVGQGPKIKRMRFASRARIHGYIKHRSYVKVILATK